MKRRLASRRFLWYNDSTDYVCGVAARKESLNHSYADLKL